MLSGQTHDQAFESVFGGSHYALEQQLERFFRDRERLWRLPHEHFRARADPRVRALESPRWNARLGELLISRRLPDQAALAEQRFAHALDEEPDLVPAHTGLATALVIQGKPGGEPNIERALELAPQDARTRLCAGEYFLERARASSPLDRARLERARRELERALELASDLGAAYYALGQTYLLPGEDPQYALAPLEHAHALMSWQRDVTLALGEAHLRTGQSERARQLLERVVRGSHNEQTRRRAEELLAELGSGRPADAR
jgi:tetratricopeptide (TPR) repeat protein